MAYVTIISEKKIKIIVQSVQNGVVDSHIDPNSIEKNIFCQLQIPYQKIQKVLFKIYYAFVKFLLRSRVVVERSLLIPSQTSTFK